MVHVTLVTINSEIERAGHFASVGDVKVILGDVKLLQVSPDLVRADNKLKGVSPYFLPQPRSRAAHSLDLHYLLTHIVVPVLLLLCSSSA